MYRDMHLMRNKQLGRLHERLARELNKQKMDDNDRRLEALKANDFEAYKELLRQTYGPLSDDDRFAGEVNWYQASHAVWSLLIQNGVGNNCWSSHYGAVQAFLSVPCQKRPSLQQGL